MSLRGAAAGLLTVATAATAVPLHWLADARSVASSGTVSTTTQRVYFDGTPAETEVVTDARREQPIEHAPVPGAWAFDASDGLRLHTPMASLDGQAAQTSSLSADGIRFTGVADVLATAAAESESGRAAMEGRVGTASGRAESAARWTFALESAQPMWLTMSSNLGLRHAGSFSFTFTGDNGFAWAPPAPGANDSSPGTFTQWLDLRPGTYTLEARLSAGVDAVQGEMRGERASAAFSLLAAAVPEPPAALLALAGLLWLGGVRRAAQAVPPTVSRSSRSVG